MWWLRMHPYFKEQLRDADAVVFCGGGFLKFRTQGLNYYVEQIIKVASRRDIPVMMNGVGIEGYDEKDPRCRHLKSVINRNCVKVITTRDDIDTLQKHYIENPLITTALVGDCALWVPECYGLTRREERKVVGINLIRGKIFQAYGNHLSELDLHNFYKNLIVKVEERGWEWVLFSNGMKADQVFGRKLLRSLGYSIPDKLLPVPSTALDMLRMISSFRGVFGARLHACITSYALDIPVVGLIWSEKLQIFSELIGKRENFFPENEMNVDKILDALEKQFETPAPYNKEVREKLRKLTKEYLQVFISEI